MTELANQQLADLMLTLFERERELRPRSLHFSKPHSAWFLHLRMNTSRTCDKIDTELATQLCESSMVRWLANNGLAPGIAEDEHYAPGENRFSVCLNTPSLGIFWASTLVEALAAACTAVLDTKQSEVTRD